MSHQTYPEPPGWQIDPDGTAPARPHVDEVHRGQLRIALRLADEHAGRLLFVAGIGWHEWTGTRWERDEKNRVTLAVQATLKNALIEAADMSSDDRKVLHADVRKCESKTGVDGVLWLASAMPQFAVTARELDADPYTLNTATGTLDLRSGALRPHDPAEHITKVCGTGYDVTATAASWEAFLEASIPDPEVRAFLRRLIGLALVGKVVEHVLPIFTGTGRNGKGVFARAIALALGDYTIEAEPELLLASKYGAHPTGQLDLRGARLATVQETDQGRELAVGTVKRLTGGDPIRARAMRQDYVQFDPSHLVILTTNHLPAVPADDPALWSRLLVVPWDVSFAGREDTGLTDRLALELPGILRWAVAGYEEYTRIGLSPPEAVKVATDGYRATADDLARFLEEECLTGPHWSVRRGELWEAWTAWCRSAHVESGRQPDFTKALEQRGFTQGATRGQKLWRGVALQGEDESAGQDRYGD
ncbi:phage/plasmid primase, P4 family [Jannaschia sp. R86511]|uniref:DNA primase family protein n=1 Tax=Jannaschia sp. R86511 TaxID=3093853 RepID=UPI0036D4285A